VLVTGIAVSKGITAAEVVRTRRMPVTPAPAPLRKREKSEGLPYLVVPTLILSLTITIVLPLALIKLEESEVLPHYESLSSFIANSPLLMRPTIYHPLVG